MAKENPCKSLQLPQLSGIRIGRPGKRGGRPGKLWNPAVHRDRRNSTLCRGFLFPLPPALYITKPEVNFGLLQHWSNIGEGRHHALIG